MVQVKKQFLLATANRFFLELKSPAIVLVLQSILPMVLPLPICFIKVVFLQLSSYCELEPSSTSSKWKLLLQLPVRIELPSCEAFMPNLSNIAQFYTISHNFDFIPSFIIIVLTGFLGAQMSQILTLRQSRVAMYLPFLRKVAPVQLDSSSYMQLLWFTASPKASPLACTSAEVLRSPILRVPLLIPQTNRLSEVGCTSLQVTISFCSSVQTFGQQFTIMKGWSGFQRLHIKICPSSELKTYSQFLVIEIAFIGFMCLLGKLFCIYATYPVSTTCSLGMLSSFPADFTTFFSDRSNIFQILMVRGLVVANFRQRPWGLSHCIPTISSQTSILLRGSNSLL